MPRSMIGVLLSFVAVLTGVITGILVKRVGVEINIGTTLFYRFLFSLPFLFMLLSGCCRLGRSCRT